MTSQQPVRQNYWAILVAAVACFLFEACWYTLFLQSWLDGIGRTRQWLMASGMSQTLQFATALVSAAVIAMAISCVTQLTGPQTALRGIKVARSCGWASCSPPGPRNMSSRFVHSACWASTPASGFLG